VATSINACLIDWIDLAPMTDDTGLVWFLGAHDAPQAAQIKVARKKPLTINSTLIVTIMLAVQPNRGHCV
jgi:hypothetical protein